MFEYFKVEFLAVPVLLYYTRRRISEDAEIQFVPNPMATFSTVFVHFLSRIEMKVQDMFINVTCSNSSFDIISIFFYKSHLDPLVNREAVDFLGMIYGGLFSGLKRFNMLSLFGIPDL